MQSNDWVRPYGDPPLCRCGHPARLLQSHTSQNPNQWFFTCDMGTAGCQYWTWADKLSGYPNLGSQPQPQQQQPAGPGATQPLSQLPHYTEYGSPAGPNGPYGAGPAAAAGPGPGLSYPASQHQQYQGQPHGGTQPLQQQHGYDAAAHTYGSQGSQGGSQGSQQQQQLSQQQQLQQPWSQVSPSQQQQQHWQQGGQWQPHPGQGPSQQQQQPSPWQDPSQQYNSNNLQQQPQPQQQQWTPFPPPQQYYQQQGGPGAGQWQQQPPQPQPQPSPSQPVWNQGVSQQQWGPPGPQQTQQPYQQQQTQWAQSPQQQQQPPWGYNSPQQQQQPPWGYNSPPPPQQQQQQYHQQQPVAASPAAGGPSPAPGSASSPAAYQVVRIIDLPDNPIMFGLKVAGYNRLFVDTLKSTRYGETGRSWDAGNRQWKVRRDALPQVKQLLLAAGFRLLEPGKEDSPAAAAAGHNRQQGAGGGNTAAAGPSSRSCVAVDLLSLESSNACVIPLVPQEAAEAQAAAALPPDLWGALLPHQQQGVLAGLRRQGRLLLADDMGLGKTAQAIALAACYPGDWPLLVVTPTSLLSSWSVELEAWLPPSLKTLEGNRPHTIILRSDKDKRKHLAAGFPMGPHVLLTTYKLVQQLRQETLARYQVVICDEAHKLKNPTTEQSKFIGAVVRGARRAILLTGTPLLSRPIEVWPQIDMLRPRVFGTYDDFGKKYCCDPNSNGRGGGAAGGGGSGNGWRPKYLGANPATADELHTLLLANVMVRRTKGQAGVELPDKTRLKVSVPLSESELPRLRSIRAAMDAMSAGGQSDSLEAKRLVNEYRVATGEAKVEGVSDFIRGLPGIKPAQAAAAAAADDDDDEDNTANQQQGAAAGAGSSAAAAAAAAEGGSGGSGGGVRGKVLVFAHHQSVLDALQSKLCEADGVGFIRIDGHTAGTERQAQVSRFQTDPAVRLGLLSMKAAGVGLTLTAADTIVLAELDWNPTDLRQCEDRIHRVGQKQHCTIYYCFAPESADSLMWGTLVRKLRVVGATVDGSSQGASQGLSDMQYWQQVGAEQQEAGEGGPQVSPAAAAAAAAAAAGIAAGSNHHKRAREEGPGAAAGSGERSARRSLLNEFVATGLLPGGAVGTDTRAGSSSELQPGSTSGVAAAAANTQNDAAGAATAVGATGSGEQQQQQQQQREAAAAAAAADDGFDVDAAEWAIVDAVEAEVASQRHATQGSQSTLHPGDTAALAGHGNSNPPQQQQQQQQQQEGGIAAGAKRPGHDCRIVLDDDDADNDDVVLVGSWEPPAGSGGHRSTRVKREEGAGCVSASRDDVEATGSAPGSQPGEAVEGHQDHT